MTPLESCYNTEKRGKKKGIISPRYCVCSERVWWNEKDPALRCEGSQKSVPSFTLPAAKAKPWGWPAQAEAPMQRLRGGHHGACCEGAPWRGGFPGDQRLSWAGSRAAGLPRQKAQGLQRWQRPHGSVTHGDSTLLLSGVLPGQVRLLGVGPIGPSAAMAGRRTEPRISQGAGSPGPTRRRCIPQVPHHFPSPGAVKAGGAVPEETAAWLTPGGLQAGSNTALFSSLPLPPPRRTVASSQQDELVTPGWPWEALILGCCQGPPMPGAGSSPGRQGEAHAPVHGQPLRFAAFCFAQQGKPHDVSLFQHGKRW